MSRALSSEFATAISGAHVDVFPLIEMAFGSGTVYLCGLDFDVAWNGNTYQAALGLIGIEVVQETASSVQGLKVQISGVPPAAIALALTEDVQGRAITLRLATLDAARALAVDTNVWSGYMDTLSIDDGVESAVVTISAEHKMATWDRPRPRLYTDARQQALYPGDRGLEYVAALENASIVWPSKEFFKT